MEMYDMIMNPKWIVEAKETYWIWILYISTIMRGRANLTWKH